MPAMVSQSQDWCEGSPSRSGSVMSLDSSRQGQRPSSAKTPPSYYDAVRSRHSLSQPLNKPKQQQQQQLKYNSLPRPLPQRVPPTNGHGPVRAPWPDDQPKSYPELPRLVYDSPPKPANHVPLQIHQDKDGPRLSRLGHEKLSGSCSPRGNGEQLRKDMYRNIPVRSDVRPPPPVPGLRAPLPRSPENGSMKTNSLPRREILPSTDSLRRGYSMNSNGNLHSPYSTNSSRASMDGPIHYEPRYSKSGKLGPRPLSQNAYEPRSMPAPAVQLRTGPLGSYPDAETLKKSEMARQLEKSYSPESGVDYDRKQQRLNPQRNDMSQQIFVDTNSYVNGHPAVADHLAIPYQIPQLSPKNSRSAFEVQKMCNGKDSTPPRIQPKLTSPSNSVIPYGNNQLPNCRRAGSDAHNVHLESRNRRQQEGALISPKENGHTYANHGYNNPQKHASPSETRSDLSNGDNDVIYANHQMSVHSRSLHKMEPQRPGIQRTPPRNNMYNYEKPQGPIPGIRNGYREPPESSQNGSLIYENQPNYNFTYVQHGDQKPPYESSRPERRLPPPVSQKPHPSLPQPSQMIMVTETRNWNGQAISYSKDMSKSAGWNGQENPHPKDFTKTSESNAWNVQNNTHPKDFNKASESSAWNGQNSNSLVKPTPRMSRVSSTRTYQCANNEQQFYRSGSPNPSIRSGYESSSTSSIRDYGRKPSKSDSAVEQNGSYGSSSKLRGEQCFLSTSMSSLCSDTSSISSRRRHEESGHVINAWKKMNEELKKRKEKGSVFSASPWEREEKEKMQREQLSESRRLRDREISFLESLESRTEKQEEWLRILRLEKEFQRRAEQEDEDDDEEEEEEEEDTSVCSEGSSKADSEKTEDFHGDKLTVIPNERLGLKLLDDLIETKNSSSNSYAEAKCEPNSLNKATSEKHFIPLELTIPDRDLHQPSSLPNLHTSSGNNILQVFENQDHSTSSNRASKPPIPAPRPSKAFTPIVLSETSPLECAFDSRNADTSSLTKLDISDSSAFFCASENDRSEDLSHDNWLIEVSSFDVPQTPKHQQNDDLIKEESIYENIKPYDPPSSKPGNQDYSRNLEFGCHTLPKSTSQSLISRDHQKSSYHEKKFPTMGISSTLSRKVNGLTEADILPTLYATSKVKNIYSMREQIPSDLEDKSPEFKKMWVTRPEKLTFQDKIRKFSIQAGENDLPRDKVKNSRAQRELEIKFNDGQKRAAALSES
ncbi:uncharacterized protein LOC129224072 [Uloborus diversus]|uniref:uncharacterized protein LOC129224072 n=1 Tax=Uloborus diversus TaxID=327109 RepID=UPI00240A2E41|nr:uncharacterized protein LOC129224072 [Uloborus diversus]